MRMKFLFVLLALTLVAAALFPLTKFDAARSAAQTRERGTTRQGLNPTAPQTRALPNYDIRLEAGMSFLITN